jgi:23S rRNA pseudoU1915 N3-methylase RlmH
VPSSRPSATSAPIVVVGTTGVAYLGVATAVESLPSSTVARIGLEVARHLSQYSQYQSAGFSEANVALRVLPGSVVIQVTISGEQVDGASLARQLESDVDTGRLELLVTIGYVPQSAGPHSQLAEPLPLPAVSP